MKHVARAFLHQARFGDGLHKIQHPRGGSISVATLLPKRTRPGPPRPEPSCDSGSDEPPTNLPRTRKVRAGVSGDGSGWRAGRSLQRCPRRQLEQEKARPNVGHTRRRQGVCMRCSAAQSYAVCWQPRAETEKAPRGQRSATVPRCHPSAGHQ